MPLPPHADRAAVGPNLSSSASFGSTVCGPRTLESKQQCQLEELVHAEHFVRKIGHCWRAYAGSLVDGEAAVTRPSRRVSILLAVPALTILSAAIASPANAERLTY